MNGKRTKRKLVSVAILGLCSCAGPGDPETTAELSPAELADDVDFLFRQLDVIHPDIRANVSEGRYLAIRRYLRDRCDRPLTLRRFYENARTAVENLDDGHTFVHPPLAETPDGQRKEAQAQLDAILVTPGNQNSYELIPDRKACILRFDSCGLPGERPRQEALFAEMFAAMRKDNVKGLIIDLRKNGGGFSGTGASLIRHFARTPFRQYEKIAKRLSPPAVSFYRSVGIDYMSFLKEECDASRLTLGPDGLPTERDFTVEAKFVEPVEEPRRFAGPVCVLIGRGTYSSAMLFASTVRHYHLATLIGQETFEFVRGNRHCGDVVLVELPHSHLTAQVSTAIFTVMRSDDEKDARIIPDHRVSPEKRGPGDRFDNVELFALDFLEKEWRK